MNRSSNSTSSSINSNISSINSFSSGGICCNGNSTSVIVRIVQCQSGCFEIFS